MFPGFGIWINNPKMHLFISRELEEIIFNDALKMQILTSEDKPTIITLALDTV